MIALPLGLRAKVLDFPVVTTLLVLFTVAYSYRHLQIGDQVEEQIVKSQQMQTFLDARWKFTIEICHKNFEKDLCEHLAKSLTPQSFIDSRSLQKKVSNSFDRVSYQKLMDLFEDQTLYDSEKTKYKSLASFGNFRTASEELKNFTVAVERKLGLFSRATASFKALFRAQFLHDGWLHLLSNMIFLLLIAGFVEQRLGPVRFILVYFIGGMTGLWLHVITSSQQEVFIVGASANVFAIAGAFVSVFWQRKIRVWVSFFGMWNKIVFIPALFFFLGWMLLEEMSGALLQFNSSGGGGVAHLAHLGGFLVGAGASFGFDRLRKEKLLPEMTFPYEVMFAKMIAEKFDQSRQLKIYNYWLTLNPDNHLAYLEACRLSFILMVGRERDNRIQAFMQKHFDFGFRRVLAQRDVDFLSIIPVELNLGSIVGDTDPQDLVTCINLLLAKHDYWPAFNLIDLYFQRHNGSHRTGDIHLACKAIVVAFPNDLIIGERFQSFCKSHPESMILNYLGEIENRRAA